MKWKNTMFLKVSPPSATKGLRPSQSSIKNASKHIANSTIDAVEPSQQITIKKENGTIKTKRKKKHPL